MHLISEHNTTIDLSDDVYKLLGKKQVHKKCALQFSRAVALCSLSVLIKQTPWTITAFDALQDFGLAGIQWHKYLHRQVNIVVNTPNQLKSQLLLNLEKNNEAFDEKSIKIVSEIPQAHLHQNKYTFIYIEACGSAVLYFDAVMSSIRHGGIVCITSTDTSILQNKSPAAAHRLYQAKLWKTEYGRELAVRVILAGLARAAARWSKGIKVELCVGLEHGYTVVCRVFRGSQFGEKSATNLAAIAHCQLCQARNFIPDSMYLQDDTACVTLCDCSNNEIKAPVLQLGPAWSGPIYSQDFLLNVLDEMRDFKLNCEHIKLVEQLIVESACCKSSDVESELLSKIAKKEKDLNCNDSPSSKKIKLDSIRDKNVDAQNPCLKSTASNLDANVINDGLISSSTAFYFDFQHHSVKGCDPPNMLSVINTLRKAGFAASKSHFGPRCIRTSANLKELKDILVQISKVTKKHDEILSSSI